MRPSNLPESIAPKVTWRQVAPAEVLDGLNSLARRDTQGVLYDPIGEGVETFLSWAKSELAQAEIASAQDLNRHTTQAVGHAKRALDCIFDEYIRRFWLESRLPKRPMFSAKIELLKSVPGLDLPARLIPAIVSAPRDKVEHEHHSPTMEQAALAVEAAHVVVGSLTTKTDPLWGDALCGSLSGGTWSGEWGTHQYFTGFHGPIGLTWRCSDGRTRSASGPTEQASADLIWADLADFSPEEHTALLEWWSGFSKGDRSGMSERALRQKLKLAHLDGPE